MPRNSRKNLQGLFFHVMCQGINKEYIFETSFLKNKYRETLKKKMRENNIEIIAYCIMDNHVHMLFKIEEIEDMTKFMKQVNTSYARFYNYYKNRVGYVFRNRFISKSIVDETYLRMCIFYIHRNPVEAHMVRIESEYEFSSYNEYLNQNKFVIIDDLNKNILNQKMLDSIKSEFQNISNEKLEKIMCCHNIDSNNIEKLLQGYDEKNINETIENLSKEENVSERKIAKILDISRYKVRKVLNGNYKSNKDTQDKK